MLPRTLETEAMDSEAEAVDYDTMDHSAVNRVFVDDFLAAWKPAAAVQTGHTLPTVLDIGTGTAQIPIELCQRGGKGFRVVAIDLSAEMLKVAERNIAAAGLGERIKLQRVDAKRLPFDDESFDAVVSNSILHHIPDPLPALGEMLRVLRNRGRLVVRDLLRPHDADEADRLVETYAPGANPHQKQMFRDSFHAAFTLAEIGAMLRALGCPEQWVKQTSDRHWTIIGEK